MIARYRRMKGYNVFYPFGFDDNGWPSERLVEKETGGKAKDLPRSVFAKNVLILHKNMKKNSNHFGRAWVSLAIGVCNTPR